jgi:uncharacterized membrane protein|tara:strand:+ start:97 stop:408 length:312 start_codon:yes stop_codon:yes gene_type:complete
MLTTQLENYYFTQGVQIPPGHVTLCGALIAPGEPLQLNGAIAVASAAAASSAAFSSAAFVGFTASRFVRSVGSVLRLKSHGPLVELLVIMLALSSSASASSEK